MELRRGRWQAGSHRAHDEVVGSGSHSLVVRVSIEKTGGLFDSDKLKFYYTGVLSSTKEAL
jgi:hypothetical protein